MYPRTMTSIGSTSARRQSIIRPRNSSAAPGSSPKSSGRSSGATPTRWFGTIDSVRENQNRDRPVRTRPLSGISVGRTTSNADSRSDATRSNRSSPIAYRSRTLPLRTNEPATGLAGDMDLCLQAVESGDDRWDVLEERGIVEAGVEIGEAELGGDRRVDREQVAEGPALVGCAEGGPLDDRVRLLTREAAAVDERDEDAAAGVEPETALDVLAHPLAADDEPLDQAGRLDQHVVEERRGVGQDHPLRGRVADVALVPERLVLERRPRVAAEQPGEARDPLRQDRVALVGHRRRALLARLERLLELADLGVLQ